MKLGIEGQNSGIKIILDPNLVGYRFILILLWRVWCMSFKNWLSGDDGAIFRVGIVQEHPMIFWQNLEQSCMFQKMYDNGMVNFRQNGQVYWKKTNKFNRKTNRPFAHFQLDSKILCFYTLFYKSYFPYNGFAKTMERTVNLSIIFS